MAVAHRSANYLASGFGALVLGFGLYTSLAGWGGGVDWEDRLTFDQSGELELEALGLWLGLFMAVLVGIPIGVFLMLRWKQAPSAGPTALLTLVLAAGLTTLAFWILPTGPGDPVLTPYAVFGGWFVAAIVARWLVLRIGARAG